MLRRGRAKNPEPVDFTDAWKCYLEYHVSPRSRHSVASCITSVGNSYTRSARTRRPQSPPRSSSNRAAPAQRSYQAAREPAQQQQRYRELSAAAAAAKQRVRSVPANAREPEDPVVHASPAGQLPIENRTGVRVRRGRAKSSSQWTAPATECAAT